MINADFSNRMPKILFRTVLACLLTVHMACSMNSDVPRWEFETIEPDDAKAWRVTTEQGMTYSFTNYAFTDSTLVIYAQRDTDDVSIIDGDSSKIVPASELPVIIPIEHISSMTAIGDKTIRMLTIGAVIAGVILIGVVIWGPRPASN